MSFYPYLSNVQTVIISILYSLVLNPEPVSIIAQKRYKSPGASKNDKTTAPPSKQVPVKKYKDDATTRPLHAPMYTKPRFHTPIDPRAGYQGGTHIRLNPEMNGYFTVSTELVGNQISRLDLWICFAAIFYYDHESEQRTYMTIFGKPDPDAPDSADPGGCNDYDYWGVLINKFSHAPMFKDFSEEKGTYVTPYGLDAWSLHDIKMWEKRFEEVMTKDLAKIGMPYYTDMKGQSFGIDYKADPGFIEEELRSSFMPDFRLAWESEELVEKYEEKFGRGPTRNEFEKLEVKAKENFLLVENVTPNNGVDYEEKRKLYRRNGVRGRPIFDENYIDQETGISYKMNLTDSGLFFGIDKDKLEAAYTEDIVYASSVSGFHRDREKYYFDVQTNLKKPRNPFSYQASELEGLCGTFYGAESAVAYFHGNLGLDLFRDLEILESFENPDNDSTYRPVTILNLGGGDAL